RDEQAVHADAAKRHTARSVDQERRSDQEARPHPRSGEPVEAAGNDLLVLDRKAGRGGGPNWGNANCGAPAGVIIVAAKETEIAVIVVTATENTLEIAFRAYDPVVPLPIVAPGTANKTLGSIVGW